MRQAIYRINHGDFMGQASYTTAWRIGDRVFSTFTVGTDTLPVMSFTLQPYERDRAWLDTETILRGSFNGELTRIS